MSETAERLKSELFHLPASERAELAHFLIQTLDDEADADADTAWDDELAQRMAEIKGGNAIGQPAERVFAELRAKYS